jgi:hypothetical protein
MTQKGQSLIEALLASMATLLSFGLVLMMLYRGLVYFTARHCLNELLLCLASMTVQIECEQAFKKRTEAFLIFKENSQVLVRKHKDDIRVAFLIKAPGTPDMELKRKINLPLKRNL